MIDWFSWNGFLFAGKWVFVGLIYLALFVLLIGVRRELAVRVGARPAAVTFNLGRLRVLSPGGATQLRAGAELALQSDNTLGSAPETDLQLGDPYVSARHARLYWDGAGWWVEDLGSRNGTLLNQNPCPPRVPQRAAAGSQLRLGDVILELVE